MLDVVVGARVVVVCDKLVVCGEVVAGAVVVDIVAKVVVFAKWKIVKCINVNMEHSVLRNRLLTIFELSTLIGITQHFSGKP